MSALSETGEIVVAELDGRTAGAVAYVGPGKPKADFFRPEWPVMRMLVVAPDARGAVALPMYRRMGFTWFSTAPAIHGVAYDVYTKGLMHAGGSRS